jgi:hypothetical protein
MSRTEDYFNTFVVRNFRAYRLAENELTLSTHSSAEDAVKQEARDNALVAGMNAAVPAFHLLDVALVERPPWVPATFGKDDALSLCRDLEQAHCFMICTGNIISDLTLLGDVVDAYKHAELTRRLPKRLLTTSRATVVVGSGWGEMHFGESKWGGTEQVIVLTDSMTKKRALLVVLQNVVDMWRRVMNLPLEAMGK